MYDYFIKDHLGNTRMTLTEDQEVVMYEATMEPEHESFETEVFLNITETRSTLEHFEGNNSALVTPESIGPAKMLVVTAGDVVDLQVYAKLASTTSNVGSGNQATLADALALLFGDNAVGASLYEQGVYNSLYNNRGSYLASVLDPNAATGTKAYLNYVFFDKDFNLISSKSGYLPVTATTGFELISNNGLTIDEAGYLYVYVSNEGNSSNAGNVYFDALKVIHHKGHIVQEDHYYPFGMSISALSSSAPLSTPNRFKYNGMELQEEFDVNIYDYGARNYDAQLGRFFNIDRFSEKYMDNTPYHYTHNNPLLFVDINGDSTAYYDHSGNLLHISHDELENAIVFVEDDQLDAFNNQLFSDLINDESSDLRSFGDAYMTDGMEQFFENHLTSNKDAKGDENPRGMVNEHASYLYRDNGEVRIGTEDFEGSPGNVSWGKGDRQDSEGRFSDAKFHTHPNIGEITPDGRGIYVEGVSGSDLNHRGRNGVYNVIVSAEQIIFYNRDSSLDRTVISRKTKFKPK